MFTLQVLDRGQTFLRPLESRQSLVIGRAADADLRLVEAGVVEHHARIDPDDDAPTIAAIGPAPVLVNGRQVKECVLQLGDRIELGRAVLVVGRTVSRRATPEDVLADDRTTVREGPLRRGRGARRRLQKACWVAISVGLAAAGAILGLPYFTPANTPAPVEQLAELRQAGRFPEARTELERLRTWAGADPGRASLLQHEIDLVEAVEQAVFQRRQKVLIDSVTRSRADIERSLQREEDYAEGSEREAARIVRSQLAEVLSNVPERQAPAVASKGSQRTETEVVPPPVRPSEPGLAEESKRLGREGLHAQAIDLLQAALAQAEATEAAALQKALAAAREQARAAMTAALEQAAQLQKSQGASAALAQLEPVARRLPMGGEFAAVGRALTLLHETVAAAAEGQQVERPRTGAASDPVRRATLADLRELLEKIRVGESAGDFSAVITLLDQGARLVDERDPQFASRLRQKARDFALLADLHTAVGASFAAGHRCRITLRSGDTLELEAVDGPRLVAKGGRQLTWFDLDAAALSVLLREGRLAHKQSLGVAVLAYRSGEPEAAEALLAQALRNDARLKDAIDAVIARGRGEPGTGGYVLEKDVFVAATTVAARQTAQKLQTRIRTALREDKKTRATLVESLLAQGPSGLEALVLAFQRELTAATGRFQALPLRKQVEKLAEQRGVLDQARKFALDLIYDEEKYFYPYKPPSVSSERFAEYNRVQAEVDRRVSALRGLWNDDRYKVQVPASLAEELERIDWLAQVLSDLGELEQGALQGLDWARALQPGERVTLQTFCATPAERAELEIWRRIEEFDKKATATLSQAEREEVALTNEYRRMFRHRPLALSTKLHSAARGHAQEMSKLGYFSHFSPVDGRKTPYDRMKLVGYSFGVSENIAMHGSAAGAHDAWLHSSGHHRNLLSPSHTEFGMGNDGRNWVQNFGQGSEYEQGLRAGR